MSEYLFGVQGEDGREVVSWLGDVKKVGDVQAEVDGGRVRLRHLDDVVATAEHSTEGDLFLHRWKADDRLAEPVTHKVKR